MNHVRKSGRHAIRGPQDRRPNGGCKGCALESEARYRHSCQSARSRIRVIEDALAS